ncbi:MAG: glutathione S-transferase N-terminal domain-containing protein [Deltaproteobacteria bacterium]|jgi:glutathione S-transferase|nr:glutathione S-transferase N-terminal domain-containing protein [Deltaproteobacteria bacterium]
MNLARFWDVTTATAASAARPNFGNTHLERRKTPAEPLELYEFEVCPYCRIAREALSALSLDPLVYPCPKGGTRFRAKVKAQGGRSQFPYLVDPNTGVSMYESADIVRYLFREYGDGRVPWFLRQRAFAVPTSMLASGFRPRRGRYVVPSRQPNQLLELYSYEGSPFCRIAREALCELELPYRLHNVPRRSPDRAEFVSSSGKMQVPYLVDPNTGVAMFESAEIRSYLYDNYAL